RKLMVPLTRDGIIVSTLGRNGSIHLGRPADKITLRDIYLSVIEDKKLWASRPDVPARCVVSALEAVKNADTSGCDPVPEMIARFKKAH
ncbi:TPA: Rrf2 family transcriptional regulator, partial [Klebsiella pneumoniae]